MSIFTHVQKRRVQKSTFDLSHQKKLTGKMGTLIPILHAEALPGDEFKINSANLTRMLPMLAPLMHDVTIYMHYFFVPNRILWPNWEDFITGGEDGTAMPNHPTVQVVGGTYDEDGRLADYLGIPRPPSGGLDVNALPFAGYFKIYNEYYRDQNNVPEIADTLSDGDNGSSIQSQSRGLVLNRSWQHDYFTSALPWVQKGPEATIPLGTLAPIVPNALDRDDWNPQSFFYEGTSGGPAQTPGPVNLRIGGFTEDSAGTLGGIAPFADPDNAAATSMLAADLTNASASSINDLRRALALQQWLERNARGGSRYTEHLMSHFGVFAQDARLQRPEYIGGRSQPVQISEVIQTSANQDDIQSPASLYGHGISAGSGGLINYKCSEHGQIYGIMSVMPKTAYSQGLEKKWLRLDKFDYAFPDFASLGEQPILNKEVNVEHVKPEDTFGYTPRYSEYKYINDSYHGEFRDSLDFWHLGRKLNSSVALNQQFINCIPREDIFFVEGQAHFQTQIWNQIKAKRPLPYFGTPKQLV